MGFQPRTRKEAAAVRCADPAAWQAFADGIIKLLKNHGLRQEDAEDAFGEAWIVAFSDGPLPGSDFGHWFFGVARNKARDILRHRQTSRNAETIALESVTSTSPADVMDDTSGNDALASVLHLLPPETFGRIRALAISGSSASDLAKNWDASPAAFRRELSRERALVRLIHGNRLQDLLQRRPNEIE